MKATTEPLEGNKVKLSVEVDADEFEKAVDAAFRKIAHEVRIPGFRPGKAPRKLLEARIGVEAAREQAIHDALPEYFAQAAMDTETDVIAPPEIDITSGQEDGPLLFDAVVEVRQKVTIPGYQGLRVTVPSPLVTDDDVADQIDRLRRQSATLEPAGRPAQDGDHVSIDIKGEHDGEVVPGLTADDYLYEVGAASIVPELDQQLRGKKAGDILDFDAAVPGGEAADSISFRVLVKDVKKLVLPEVTDEWAADASEFETVAELRDDIRSRIGEVKKVNAILTLRNAAVEALANLVDDEVSEALVNAEMQERLHQLLHRLEHQKASLADYVAASGRTPDEFQHELQATAQQAVKADLALRALIESESLTTSDDEIDAELAKAAERTDTTLEKIREQLHRDDRMADVRFDLTKSKAVDWLLEHVEVVDEEGQPVDRTLLEMGGPASSDQGGDEAAHQHPHEHGDNEHGDEEHVAEGDDE